MVAGYGSHRIELLGVLVIIIGSAITISDPNSEKVDTDVSDSLLGDSLALLAGSIWGFIFLFNQWALKDLDGFILFHFSSIVQFIIYTSIIFITSTEDASTIFGFSNEGIFGFLNSE